MPTARTLFVRPLEVEDGEGVPGLGAFLTSDRPPSEITTAAEERENRPEFLKFILGVTGIDTALDIVDKFTSTAPQEAVARQVQQSRQMQAARSSYVAEQRGEVWSSVAPWAFLVVGVLGVSVILGVAAVRKKGHTP